MLYTGLQASMLYSVTSLWGNPLLAAEMWSRYQPDSIRATQYLSQQLQADNYYHAARKVLQEYLERHPNTEGVRIQVLHISCGIEEPSLNTHLVDKRIESLPTYHFQRGAFDALARVYENTLHTPCEGVDSDTIYRLADLMAKNPAYQAYTLELHNLHILMARIGIERRDLDLTMHHLERALAANHNIPTLLFTVKILTSAGLYSTAKEFTEQAHTYRPSNPLKAAIWDRQIRRIMAELETLMAS
jgi:tetratricopeptide (TPR) repeat protein